MRIFIVGVYSAYIHVFRAFSLIFKGFVGACIRPLVIIRRGVTACGGIGYMHFIQNIQKCKSVVFPLFMRFFGCFIHRFPGNTEPGIKDRLRRSMTVPVWLVATLPPHARSRPRTQLSRPARHLVTPRATYDKIISTHKKISQIQIKQLG